MELYVNILVLVLMFIVFDDFMIISVEGFVVGVIFILMYIVCNKCNKKI